MSYKIHVTPLQVRFYLASMAMKKLIYFESNQISHGLAFPPAEIASKAYQIADEMIEQGKTRPEDLDIFIED